MASPRPVSGIGLTAMVGSARGVEASQIGEQMSGGLHEVAVFAEIQGGARCLCALGGLRAEQQGSLAGPNARRVQAHLRPRRVMGRQHARRERLGAGLRAALQLHADQRFDGLPRHAAGAEQARGAAEAGDDGRFDARPGTAPPSSTASMRPSRSPSTWSASVGLTRPERLAEGAATGRPACCQQRMGEGMGRHAQADAVETGAGEIGDRAGRRHRHHEGQRAGPERLRQSPRGVVEHALGASAIRSCPHGRSGG